MIHCCSIKWRHFRYRVSVSSNPILFGIGYRCLSGIVLTLTLPSNHKNAINERTNIITIISDALLFFFQLLKVWFTLRWPQARWTVAWPRRVSEESITSSCIRLAVCIISAITATLRWLANKSLPSAYKTTTAYWNTTYSEQKIHCFPAQIPKKLANLDENFRLPLKKGQF